jgi:hypothetical protein
MSGIIAGSVILLMIAALLVLNSLRHHPGSE